MQHLKKKLFIIKYAELNTKKDNIGMFLRTLKDNISKKLSKYQAEISFDKGRMFVKTHESDFHDVLKELQKVFGIHEIEVGYELENHNMETISNALIEIIKESEFHTFKVETKRSYKDYPMTSLEISKYLGGVILKNKEGIIVDVHHPEVTFFIEIRRDRAYIYFERYVGLGGYPVGTLGKGLLMLSGGIDSPVAGYLTMKRGVKLEAIYFESPPHTSVEAKNKVLRLAEILGEYGSEVKVHVIPFTQIQEAIYKSISHDYMVTIMRRMMYRIAEKIAHQNRCKI